MSRGKRGGEEDKMKIRMSIQKEDEVSQEPTAGTALA